MSLLCTSLIQQSQAHFDQYKLSYTLRWQGFGNGAKWMAARMEELSPLKTYTTTNLMRFNYYGILKYGLSLVISSAFLTFTEWHCLLRIPIVILVFYSIEIHFAFLFPIAIHQQRPIFSNCIRSIYHIGILKVLFTVIYIAAYMIIGLFNIKQPLYNWYIGCLSILIWYNNDLRHWLSQRSL